MTNKNQPSEVKEGGALAPCPFHPVEPNKIPPGLGGSLVGTANELETAEDVWSWTVRCWCGAEGPEQPTEAEAITAWNRRPPSMERGEAETFQARVTDWMLACFPPAVCLDRVERCDRFVEEALELVQATGYGPERAHALVDYVFARPAGEVHQEVGGVMVTLAALVGVLGDDMVEDGELELARIMQPAIMDKIRAKQAAKPTGSALPVAAPSPAPSADPDEIKAAYQQGWSDREADIIERAERILPAPSAVEMAGVEEVAKLVMDMLTDDTGAFDTYSEQELNAVEKRIARVLALATASREKGCSPAQTYYAQHVAHCNQGEYIGSCKYGEHDCPVAPSPASMPQTGGEV